WTRRRSRTRRDPTMARSSSARRRGAALLRPLTRTPRPSHGAGGGAPPSLWVAACGFRPLFAAVGRRGAACRVRPGAAGAGGAPGRVGAELVAGEDERGPFAQLGLLARLRPTAVWFSQDECAALAAAAGSTAFTVDSIRRVLTGDPPADGATAFAREIGAQTL